MHLTDEQAQIGKDNFFEALSFSRRDFLKGTAAAGTGLGAAYFGYKQLEGDRVKVAWIGTGDEGSVLLTEHPENYMEIVAIADLRPFNRKRAFTGDGNDARIGLNKKLGESTAAKIRTFGSHKELLAAKDELGLEAVVIAVPLSQHHPIAMECLDAGLHVLSEKLMAHKIIQCKEMVRKARENKLLLAVGHQRHYSVLYDNANYLVRSGVLGDIKHIRAQWHRNNSFPTKDSWRNAIPGRRIPADDVEAIQDIVADFGYEDVDHLVNWRLYDETGGGLMAELGSHQLDACSIFLGKVKPIAVQGFGGRNFYGVKGVGSPDKQKDDREIDDHVYVTFEFPGPHYAEDENDVVIVTYSSLNTNSFEPYGETILGSRGTMIVKTEKEVMLFKENGGGIPGGPDQRLHVVDSETDAGPVLDAYETMAASPAAVDAAASLGDKISRGYREEMEHFCHCIRSGNFESPERGGLRCNGVIAMGDAIMALTSNLAMKHRKRIVFKPEWFDPDSDAVPESDPDIVG